LNEDFGSHFKAMFKSKTTAAFPPTHTALASPSPLKIAIEGYPHYNNIKPISLLGRQMKMKTRLLAFLLLPAVSALLASGTVDASAGSTEMSNRPGRQKSPSKSLRGESPSGGPKGDAADVKTEDLDKELSKKLFTPALWPVAPDNLACNLSNVKSSKAESARIRIVSQGGVLYDSGLIAIEPRNTYDAVIDGLEKGGPVYCEFSFDASRGDDDFAGSIKIFRTATTDIDPDLDETHFQSDTDMVALPAT